MKKSLHTVLLVVLALAAAVVASRTPTARRANLAMSEGSFPPVYVQWKVGSSEECLVSGRSGTTAKRSESSLAKARWDCQELPTPAGAPVLLAVTNSRPSYLFVPFTSVDDLAYPLLYEKARNGAGLDLPPVQWVHLFFDRQFRGLYLQVHLPGRNFSEQRERRRLGLAATAELPPELEAPRLELMVVEGDDLVCLDHRMRLRCRVYTGNVAEGIRPMPRTAPITAVLEQVAPRSELTFILSETDPTVLEPFPLPVKVRALVPVAQEPYRDHRYAAWLEPPAASAEAEERLAALVGETPGEVATFLTDLDAAFAASCEVMECDPAAARAALRESPSYRWLVAHGLVQDGLVQDGLVQDGGGGE